MTSTCTVITCIHTERYGSWCKVLLLVIPRSCGSVAGTSAFVAATESFPVKPGRSFSGRNETYLIALVAA